MDASNVQELTKNVIGFLSQNGSTLREGEVLYYLAKRSPKNGTIVEIGSWQGKSTIWLGKGSQAGNGCKVYAIDPHVGSPEHQNGTKIWTFDAFKKNINQFQLDELVEPIVKTSSEAAHHFHSAIDLLFIDGAHEYEAVKEDFLLWSPKVKEGGIIAFHDSFLGWPGVNRLVREELFTSSYFCNVRYINSITFAQKAAAISFTESFEKRLNFMIKTLHEKSMAFPQPFKSLTKHLVWKPRFKKWLNDLKD